MSLRSRWGSLAGALVALALAACSSPPVVVPVKPAVTAPPVVARKPPRLGLALGGGAARGFAHVGVIQVLEEAGIRPDLVVGTSAGSFVASLYASGKSGVQLQQVAESMEEATFTDWTLPLSGRGLLRGEALARYVNEQVRGRLIEAMALPLGIVATDLSSGDGVLFQRGDTGTAVRASSAVPWAFQPVAISGREYVDGGLVAPVPVLQARAMGAEVVLAVDISSAPQAARTDGMLQVLLQTFSIMGQSVNRLALRDADVVVRPVLGDVGSTDFAARRKSIAAGRAAMQQALPKLRQLLASEVR